MRRSLLLAISIVAACSGTKAGGSGTSGGGPTARTLSPKDIVKQSSPAIVFVESGDGDKRATGTGFILDKSGLIATNLHVVRGNTTIKVRLYGGEVYPVQQIAGFNEGRDLAVLRIQPARALPTVKLGDSDAMAAGDQIITIGNPLGVFDYTVSSGLVSQIRPVCTADMVAYATTHEDRFHELAQKVKNNKLGLAALSEPEREELGKLLCKQELTYFQISAPISQGSSGGPLFNQAGEVVGITTAIISAGQNINLAIPTNYLKAMLAQPEQISLAEFAKSTRESDETDDPDQPERCFDDPATHQRRCTGGGRVERRVPIHPLSVFDGCNGKQVTDLVDAIGQAILARRTALQRGQRRGVFPDLRGAGHQVRARRGQELQGGDGRVHRRAQAHQVARLVQAQGVGDARHVRRPPRGRPPLACGASVTASSRLRFREQPLGRAPTRE